MNPEQRKLAASCPSCLTRRTVSRGRVERRTEQLLAESHRDLARLYGLEPAAALFDCELAEAASPGRRFFHFLKLFSPMNRQPYRLASILVSGAHQLHAFLFYFPRLESCGANIRLARAAAEPAREIQLNLELRRLETVEQPRMLTNDRIISVAGDLIFRGEVERAHRLEFEYNTRGQLELQLRRKMFTLHGRTFPEFPLSLSLRSRPVPSRLDSGIRFSDLTAAEIYRVRSTMEITWAASDNR